MRIRRAEQIIQWKLEKLHDEQIINKRNRVVSPLAMTPKRVRSLEQLEQSTSNIFIETTIK